MDAFCNSFCVASCSLAIFPLIWAADDVNEIILDTFGFLFLHGLADYSKLIEYGIEQSDFDQVIKLRESGMVARILRTFSERRI